MSANDPNRREQSFTLRVDHPEAEVDTTVKAFKATRRTRVDGATYVNPTGLATHADNTFAVSLKNGATVVANGIDTTTGTGAAIVANTWTPLTLAAALAARTLEPGDELDILLDETGSATLPAGSMQVHLTEISDN